MLERIYSLSYRLLMVVVIDAVLLLSILAAYDSYTVYTDQGYRVNKMYRALWAQTGLIQEYIPLVINDTPIVNAVNSGDKITIYKGLIDQAHSEDEIAWVLGHEIAHTTLGHLEMRGALTDVQIQVMESNADKMGALYMMKAGYDVCKGREMFKRWIKEKGNYLGADHPNYSYRYDEIDINCK